MRACLRARLRPCVRACIRLPMCLLRVNSSGAKKSGRLPVSKNPEALGSPFKHLPWFGKLGTPDHFQVLASRPSLALVARKRLPSDPLWFALLAKRYFSLPPARHLDAHVHLYFVMHPLRAAWTHTYVHIFMHVFACPFACFRETAMVRINLICYLSENPEALGNLSGHLPRFGKLRTPSRFQVLANSPSLALVARTISLVTHYGMPCSPSNISISPLHDSLTLQLLWL